jgi:hypothetical protein
MCAHINTPCIIPLFAALPDEGRCWVGADVERPSTRDSGSQERKVASGYIAGLRPSSAMHDHA